MAQDLRATPNGDVLRGGGIFNSGSARISRSSIAENDADVGGGIANSGSSARLQIDQSAFDNNHAVSGGGIHSIGGASSSFVTVTNSSVMNHTNALFSLTENGGGIWNDVDSTMIISQTSIGYNQVAANGGGVLNDGDLTIFWSTLSHNAAFSGGAILNRGNLMFDFSIAANSSSGSDCKFAGINWSYSTLHSLIENGDCASALSVDPQIDGTVIANIVPAFRLATNSPAIDAVPLINGVQPCPSSDQRGEMRPFDGDNDEVVRCDMGAYEVTSLPTAVRLGQSGIAANTSTLTILSAWLFTMGCTIAYAGLCRRSGD